MAKKKDGCKGTDIVDLTLCRLKTVANTTAVRLTSLERLHQRAFSCLLLTLLNSIGRGLTNRAISSGEKPFTVILHSIIQVKLNLAGELIIITLFWSVENHNSYFMWGTLCRWSCILLNKWIASRCAVLLGKRLLSQLCGRRPKNDGVFWWKFVLLIPGLHWYWPLQLQREEHCLRHWQEWTHFQLGSKSSS